MLPDAYVWVWLLSAVGRPAARLGPPEACADGAGATVNAATRSPTAAPAIAVDLVNRSLMGSSASLERGRGRSRPLVGGERPRAAGDPCVDITYACQEEGGN